MEYSILESIVEDFRVAYLGEMEKKGVNSAWSDAATRLVSVMVMTRRSSVSETA